MQKDTSNKRGSFIIKETYQKTGPRAKDILEKDIYRKVINDLD